MKKYDIGRITKIINNGNDTFTLEVVEIPTFYNDYCENIDIIKISNDKMMFNTDDIIKYNIKTNDFIVIPSEEFDYQELSALANSAQTSDEEKIQKMHESLKGLTFESEGENVLADDYFIHLLLDFNYGKNLPLEIPDEYIKFFNSDYLSNYIKNKVKENVPSIYEEIKLDEKSLADLTGSELNSLIEALRNSPNNRSYNDCFYRYLFPLAFYLDSPGAQEFLDCYADSFEVIKRIIYTSGLSAQASYYSGRGTNLGDLNEEHLFAIYRKLDKINSDKSLAMATLAYNMPTLGATEFLNSLYQLAKNDYVLDQSKIRISNVSLSGVDKKDIEGVFLFSMIERMFNSPIKDDYLTRKIKLDFINLQNSYLVNKYLRSETIEEFTDRENDKPVKLR